MNTTKTSQIFTLLVDDHWKRELQPVSIGELWKKPLLFFEICRVLPVEL
jgi:hypothetical protein